MFRRCSTSGGGSGSGNSPSVASKNNKSNSKGGCRHKNDESKNQGGSRKDAHLPNSLTRLSLNKESESDDEAMDDSGHGDDNDNGSVMENGVDSAAGDLDAKSSDILANGDSPSKKNGAENDSNLLNAFVSIGKGSCLCPRFRQYFATEFPNLPRRTALSSDAFSSMDDCKPTPFTDDDDAELMKEIIIDEFSLLLFHTVEDFNVSLYIYILLNVCK